MVLVRGAIATERAILCSVHMETSRLETSVDSKLGYVQPYWNKVVEESFLWTNITSHCRFHPLGSLSMP